ncbi:MAG: alkaline phosphatase family protein, partial [Actinomycetota bacterium]
PAVHATLGTGRYPRQHGVVDAQMRVGDEVMASWARSSPKDLEASTLADVYDPLTNNRAKIGMIAFRSWHLGMIGHGSFMKGGDKDIAVMNHRDSRLFTQPRWYSLPTGLADSKGLQQDAASVDVLDGRRDERWREHDVLVDPSDIFESPAWPLYQTRLIQGLIERKGFGQGGPTDLLYTNFKQIDLLGHAFNMLNKEVGDAVHFSDVALKRLVRILNTEVGKREWVLMLTADHGQQPNGLSVGGWPIGTDELISDLTSHFGVDEGIVEIWRPTGVWLDQEEIERANLTTDGIAQFLAGYTIRENASETKRVQEEFQSMLAERVFQAVFPSENLKEVWECGRG